MRNQPITPVVTYSPYELASEHTFNVLSVRRVAEMYLPSAGVIVDSFARNCPIGTLRNDRDPETHAEFHLDALDFQDMLIRKGVVADAVILDPPFSDRQARELYHTHDLVSDLYTGSKNRLTQILKLGGIAITCGYSSSGFGEQRGFEKLHVHHICHGGLASDMAVVVERKVRTIEPRQPARAPRHGGQIGQKEILAVSSAVLASPAPTYTAGFIAAGECERYMDALAKLPWDQHVIRMYGKQIPAPRLYTWMGRPPAKLYGKPVSVTPWTPEVQDLVERVRQATGVGYDSVNINLYRDGRDYIGWHIDPAKEGRWDYPIASVSFGVTRRFNIRPYKLDGKARVADGDATSYQLEPGSLLVMPPGYQGLYEHQLPKARGDCGTRINLTFRCRA